MVKVSELSGPALDWAVAKCEGVVPSDAFASYSTWRATKFSTDWSQGGPIIERERIETRPRHDGRQSWCAWHKDCGAVPGPTPLIAAMRCYVASKLGGSVDIPKELL